MCRVYSLMSRFSCNGKQWLAAMSISPGNTCPSFSSSSPCPCNYIFPASQETCLLLCLNPTYVTHQKKLYSMTEEEQLTYTNVFLKSNLDLSHFHSNNQALVWKKCKHPVHLILLFKLNLV